jgi:hypothetical protein
MAFDDNIRFDDKESEGEKQGRNDGLYTPITTPQGRVDEDRYGVYYEPGSVGAGAFSPGDGMTRRDIALLNNTNAAPNGWLRQRNANNDEVYMPLWIQEVKLDFSASGAEAQSRTKREFYHRFMAQPRVAISCQNFNQYQFRATSKFIYLSHKRQIALSTGSEPRLVTLHIKPPRKVGTRRDRPNGTVKGEYSPMTLLGYIEEIADGAEKGQFAPDINFAFVVAEASEGLLRHLTELVKSGQIKADQDFFGRDLNTEKLFIDKFASPVEDPNIAPPKPWKGSSSKDNENEGGPEEKPDDKPRRTVDDDKSVFSNSVTEVASGDPFDIPSPFDLDDR